MNTYFFRFLFAKHPRYNTHVTIDGNLTDALNEVMERDNGFPAKPVGVLVNKAGKNSTRAFRLTKTGWKSVYPSELQQFDIQDEKHEGKKVVKLVVEIVALEDEAEAIQQNIDDFLEGGGCATVHRHTKCLATTSEEQMLKSLYGEDFAGDGS